MENKDPLIAADSTIIPYTLVTSNSKHVLLFCHGIGSERTEDGLFSEFYERSLKDKYDAFFFDFRGHGESVVPSSCATITGMCLDLVATLQFLDRRGYESVTILAASFGASIALLTAGTFQTFRCKQAVLWNPVISYKDTFVAPRTPWARGFFCKDTLAEYFLSPGAPIPNSTFTIGPSMLVELLLLSPEEAGVPPGLRVLMVHGTEDSIVPYSTAERYAHLNSEQVEFVGIQGADHGFPKDAEKVCEITTAWFGRNLGVD